MFGLFKKKPPVLVFKNLRAFGKLPGFADFIRYRSADPEAAKIDSWITNGLSALMKQGMHDVLDKPWRLSLCQQGDKSIKVVAVLNSQDKSGRHYPFVLLAQVDNPWLLDYQPSLPLLFDRLFEFAQTLMDKAVQTQQAIIDKMMKFEQQTLVLLKRQLLEDRISALKSLDQAHAWGAWCQQQPGLNPCDWKTTKVYALKSKKQHEFPMASDNPSAEVTYWLQLREDVSGKALPAFNYYWLWASTIKKLVVEHGAEAFPEFSTLFRPCSVDVDQQKASCVWSYDENMTLLNAGNYWSKVK